MGPIRPFLIALFIFYNILLIMTKTNFADALSDGEICEQCQKVLYRTFLYYRVQTTKRLLRHKLKHLCKRYFEYRRHCLITMLPRVELIWTNMEKALNEDRTVEFQPYGTCAAIKECHKEHQPLNSFGLDDGGGRAATAAAFLSEASSITASGNSNSNTTTITTSSSNDNITPITTTTTTGSSTPSSSWSSTTTTATTEAATIVADELDNESMLMLDFF